MKLKALLIASILPFATLASCDKGNTGQTNDSPTLVLNDNLTMAVNQQINLVDFLVKEASDKQDGDLKSKVNVTVLKQDQELQYTLSDDKIFIPQEAGTYEFYVNVNDSDKNNASQNIKVEAKENRSSTLLADFKNVTLKNITTDVFELTRSSGGLQDDEYVVNGYTTKDGYFEINNVFFDPTATNSINIKWSGLTGFDDNVNMKIEFISKDNKVISTIEKKATELSNSILQDIAPSNYEKGEGKIKFTFSGIKEDESLYFGLWWYEINYKSVTSTGTEDIFATSPAKLETRSWEISRVENQDVDVKPEDKVIENYTYISPEGKSAQLVYNYTDKSTTNYTLTRFNTNVFIPANTPFTLTFDVNSVGYSNYFEMLLGDWDFLNNTHFIEKVKPQKTDSSEFWTQTSDNHFSGSFSFVEDKGHSSDLDLAFAVMSAVPDIGYDQNNPGKYELNISNIRITTKNYNYKSRQDLSEATIGYSIGGNNVSNNTGSSEVITIEYAVDKFNGKNIYRLHNLPKVSEGTYSLRIAYQINTENIASTLSLNGVSKDVSFSKFNWDSSSSHRAYGFMYIDNLALSNSDSSTLEFLFNNVTKDFKLQIRELTLLK